MTRPFVFDLDRPDLWDREHKAFVRFTKRHDLAAPRKKNLASAGRGRPLRPEEPRLGRDPLEGVEQ